MRTSKPPLPHVLGPVPDAASARKRTAGVVANVIGCATALPLVGFILLFNIALLWIKYQPLPPIPARLLAYSVTDVGVDFVDGYSNWGDDGRDMHSGSRDALSESRESELYYRLSDQGTVIALSAAAGEWDKLRRKVTRALAERRMSINPSSGSVRAVAHSGGVILAEVGGQLRLYRSGRPGAFLPKQLKGYDWERHCFRSFFAVNGRGDVIGNEYLATACASSGGTSDPHGRRLPLLWRGDASSPEDLNALIPAVGGWYLFHALDLNERGQILCLASRCSALAAEAMRGPWCLVVITPAATANPIGEVQ